MAERKWTRIIAGRYDLVDGDGRDLAKVVKTDASTWSAFLPGDVPAGVADTYRTAKLVAEAAVDKAPAGPVAEPTPDPEPGPVAEPTPAGPVATDDEVRAAARAFGVHIHGFGMDDPDPEPGPAPWFGAAFAGVLACGHRVDEGDMIRSVGTEPDDRMECYAYCGQTDPAESRTCTDCTDGSDPTDMGDYVPEVYQYDPGSRQPCDTCHGTRLVPVEHVAQSDPDEPQAWVRPTAANVAMPGVPTVPAPGPGVLQWMREHPASNAPVTFSAELAAAVGDPGTVLDNAILAGMAFDVGEGVADPWTLPAVLPDDISPAHDGWAAAEQVVPLVAGQAYRAGEMTLPSVSDVLATATAGIKAFADAFQAPKVTSAPAVDFDGSVPVPGRKQTNNRGYLIKDPSTGDFRRFANGNILAIPRATTFNKAASDNTALVAWGKRNVVVGASRRPDLVAKAHGLDVSEDREALDGLVESLEEAADAKVSADIGTLVHEYTEGLDAGTIQLAAIPPAYRGHVVSYQAALAAAGFRVVPGLMEGTVCTPRFGGVAGKFDRVLFHEPSGTYVMGDLKTGKNMTYGWDEIELQEWLYADGYNTNGTYDWNSDTWTAPEFQVRTDVGVVMWLPVQKPTKPYPKGWNVKENGEPQAGVCYLLQTDLKRGERHGEICHAVREGRSAKGSPLRWTDPPVDWDARFSAVTTVAAAGQLWESARAAGVEPNKLGQLVALAQDALRGRPE